MKSKSLKLINNDFTFPIKFDFFVNLIMSDWNKEIYAQFLLYLACSIRGISSEFHL